MTYTYLKCSHCYDYILRGNKFKQKLVSCRNQSTDQLTGFYMIRGSTKIYFFKEHNSTIMNAMAMTYPALEYQVLDFFIRLPSFSNRWNLKQNLNPIVQFVKKSLAYNFIACLSLSKMTAIEVTTRVTGTNYNCKIFFLFLINQ